MWGGGETVISLLLEHHGNPSITAKLNNMAMLKAHKMAMLKAHVRLAQVIDASYNSASPSTVVREDTVPKRMPPRSTKRPYQQEEKLNTASADDISLVCR